MLVEARVASRRSEHRVVLTTDGREHSIDIPPKDAGPGSSANGGELLALAVATCYCNDLYREAPRFGIQLRGVIVRARATFGGPGDPTAEIRYTAEIDADASESEIRALLEHTDRVAEIHQTLRAGAAVRLELPARVTG